MNINKLIGYLSIYYKLIIAFIAISFIPLIVVGVVCFKVSYTGFSTMARNHLKDEVFTIARLMDNFLTTVEHDLSNLNGDLSSFVDISAISKTSYSIQEVKPELVNQLKPYFHSFLSQHEGYKKISYFDNMGSEKLQAEMKDGVVKFASSEQLRFLGGTEFFKDSIVLNPGEVYICSLGLKDDPRIWFGTPNFDGFGSKKGVLVAEFSMISFHHFAANAHPRSDSLTIMVDNQGRYIYHPKKSNGMLSDDYPPEVVSDILSTQSGIVEELNEEIIGYVHLSDKFEEGHHWIVIHTLPKDAIFYPVKKFRTFFIGMLSVVLLGVLIAGYFSSRHFTKPIESLRKGTASIAQGNLKYRLDIQTNDEIELLANDFNHMTQTVLELEEKLKIHASDLEKIVVERTSEIEREKQKLDNIVKGIGTGLALIDRKMQLSWYNEVFEEWFGKIDISQGIKCYELANITSDECPAAQTFSDGRIGQVELVMDTCTGEKRVFQFTTGPIRNGDNIVKVLVMMQDITEKKQLESQVMHQKKMAAFGMMAAGVAHEIGNPLSSLSSLVQYTERKNYEESTKEMFALMRSNIDRIANIVREMVNFSRPPKYDWEPAQVNDIIQSAIGIAKYNPNGRGVEVKTFLDPEIPLINLVPDQLLQACLNILLNAYDAVGIEGELSVSSKLKDEKIEIIFRDNGCGMDKGVIEHVFEPFFTTKETGDGTGLGLSVSYGIIKNFGGEILVESQIGEGTAFTIVLPVGKDNHERMHTNS
jgi:signal transduction histidine kinase/HAMP domain-containing protein